MPINGLRRIWTSSIRPKLKSSIKSLFRCGRIFSFLSISRIPITLVTFSFRRSTMIFACQTSVERFQKNIRFPMTLIPSFHVLCMRGSSIRLQNSPAMSSPPICSNHRLLNCIRFIVPCLSLQTNPIPSRRNCMKQAGGWSNGRPESCTMTVPITFLKRNVRKAWNNAVRARNIARALSSRWDFSLIEVGSPLPFVSIQAIPMNRLLWSHWKNRSWEISRFQNLSSVRMLDCLLNATGNSTTLAAAVS